ncbi:MAG: hypothetical protein KC593_16440 [Myxococcales bacterium]|nr:hypothetical protein [Myxococcales bacterium]
MDQSWLVVIMVVWVAEWAALMLAPQLYSRLAFVPLITREKVLSLRWTTGGSYRDGAWAPPSVDSLGLGGLRYEDEEATGGFEGRRGWLRARHKMFGWNRVMGVVAILGSVEGETLQLESRCCPAFGVGMLVFVFVFLAQAPRISAAGGALLVLVMLVTYGYALFMLRRRVTASTSLFLDAIEARADEALARTAP